MSYISSDDITATVAEAENCGGKVGIGPIPYGGGTQIALICDPLGAGFTVYQGSGFGLRGTGTVSGTLTSNGLYDSDVSAVIDFYRAPVRLDDHH
ncbi:MAG: hypothetical protein AAFX39_01245 [Pseudomonadota bacterium]